MSTEPAHFQRGPFEAEMVDGILEFVFPEGKEFDAHELEPFAEILHEAFPDGGGYMMVQLNGSRTTTAARRFLASPRCTGPVRMGVLVVNSRFGAMLGNLWARMNRPAIEFRLVSAVTEGREAIHDMMRLDGRSP